MKKRSSPAASSSKAAAAVAVSGSTGSSRLSTLKATPAGTTTKKKKVASSPATTAAAAAAGSGEKKKVIKKTAAKKTKASSPAVNKSVEEMKERIPSPPIQNTSPVSPSKSSLKKTPSSGAFNEPVIKKSVSIEDPNFPGMRFVEVTARNYDAIDILDGSSDEEAMPMHSQRHDTMPAGNAAINRVRAGSLNQNKPSPEDSATVALSNGKNLNINTAASLAGGRPPSGRTPSPSVSRSNSSSALNRSSSQRSIAEEDFHFMGAALRPCADSTVDGDQFARNLQAEMSGSDLINPPPDEGQVNTLKPRDGGLSPVSVPAIDDGELPATASTAPIEKNELRASRFLELINVLRSSFGVDKEDILFSHFIAWKLRALPQYMEKLPAIGALHRSRNNQSPDRLELPSDASPSNGGEDVDDGMNSDATLPGTVVRICDNPIHIDDDRSPRSVIPSDATAISAITSCTGLSGFEDDDDMDSEAAVATTVTALTSYTGVTNVTDAEEEEEEEEDAEVEDDDVESAKAVATAITDLSLYDPSTVAEDTYSDSDVNPNDRSEDAIFALTPESSADFRKPVDGNADTNIDEAQNIPRGFSTASSEYEFPTASRLPTFDGAEIKKTNDTAHEIIIDFEDPSRKADDEINDNDDVSSEGDDVADESNSEAEGDEDLAESGAVEKDATIIPSEPGVTTKRKLSIPIRGTKKSESIKNLKDALLAERATAIASNAPPPKKTPKKKKKIKKNKIVAATTTPEVPQLEDKPSPYEQARDEIKSSLTSVSKQLVRSLDERDDIKPDESPDMTDFQARYENGELDEDEEELMERVAREAMLAAQEIAKEESRRSQEEADIEKENARQEAAAKAAETARKIEEIVAAAKKEAEREAEEQAQRDIMKNNQMMLCPEEQMAVSSDVEEPNNNDNENDAGSPGRILSMPSQDFSEIGVDGPGSVQEKYDRSLRRFESMLIDRVHVMCKTLHTNHVRFAPVKNVRAAFNVWKRCVKWFRKIDDCIPLSIRKLVVVHPELLWRVFCLYVSNKNLIPCSRPTQVNKACPISPEGAARLSSGFTPSPRGSRSTTLIGSRMGSFSFNRTRNQLNFDDTCNDKDIDDYADGHIDEYIEHSPEDGIASKATSKFASKYQSRHLTASVNSETPNGNLIRSSASGNSVMNSEQSKFRKKLLDIDGLWSLLKDFNVCPHLFGKAKLKEIFEEMIELQNVSSGTSAPESVEPPPPVPRRSYVSPDGRIHFKLTVFNANMKSDPSSKDRRSRSRSPAAAQVRQRQLAYGRQTKLLMAAKRSASEERTRGRVPAPNRDFERITGLASSSYDGSDVETLSTVFSLRSRSTSPGRSRSPSIVGGRTSRNTALAQMEQHLTEAACSSPSATSYEVSNPLISFNTFVKMLWRVISSFMGVKMDDPKMDSVRKFLLLMTKQTRLAMNREISKILPVLRHDSERKLTAFK